MPRGKGKLQKFSFNKGWITEANPMTYPENTCQDVENIIFDVDGAARRRPGIELDLQSLTFGGISASSAKTYALKVDTWDNVSGSGLTNFVVTQFGSTLYFHQSAGVATMNNYIGSVNFITQAYDTTLVLTEPVQVTSGMGYLFVSSRAINPFYISYSSGTGDLTVHPIEVEIRDFEGIDDLLDTDERPNVLSKLHKYNLLNQGWDESFPCVSGSNPITQTKNSLGVYPSNSDVMAFGKRS